MKQRPAESILQSAEKVTTSNTWELRRVWQTETILNLPVERFRLERAAPRLPLVFLPDVDGVNLAAQSPFQDWLQVQAVQCLVPLLSDCWWSNRVDPEREPLSSEVWLLNHLLVEFPCVALIGFGSGGQGAIRFALKDPKRFPIAVGLNADLDHFEKIGQGSSLDRLYASKESCRQDSAVLQVHPSNHPAYLFFGVESPRHPSHRGNDRLHEKLNALGVSHEFAITPLPELWQAALRFLQSALEQESRRLV